MSIKPSTICVHAGTEPDPATGAIMTPIYQTSTYIQSAPNEHKGYDYSRAGNPTRSALEKAFAELEGAKHGLAFSSGVAATDAVIRLLQPGNEVIAANDMYGGTYRLFDKIFRPMGIIFHYVDMNDLENVKKQINPNTRLIWAETPTNPLMNIVDIQGLAEIRNQHKDILLCVDNTFATPYLQNPIALGADMVMHSATKYLGGHSDVVMGALMYNSDELHEKLYFIQKSCGAVPGPQDSFLVLRGIKTLHVRMDRHCDNGEKIARFLKSHPKISKVFWPGFEDHPNHAIARKQMKRMGGMVSFELADESANALNTFMTSTRLFTLAESLGGVESLLNHPASMTHASIPKEIRIQNGLTDGLIRISIGIEDADDLILDLDQALNKI